MSTPSEHHLKDKNPAANKEAVRSSLKADKTTNTKLSKKTNVKANGSDTTTALVRILNSKLAMTPELLRHAMETLGAVVNVEMKKRKDLATVKFANVESLQKAIAASPVVVNPQITVKVVKQQVKVVAT